MKIVKVVVEKEAMIIIVLEIYDGRERIYLQIRNAFLSYLLGCFVRQTAEKAGARGCGVDDLQEESGITIEQTPVNRI